MVTILGMAEDAAGRALYQPWFEAFWKELQPLAEGVYENFLCNEGAARTRSAYTDATLARLAAIKARFDPDNFFRRNQNIAPAAAHLPHQEQAA